MKHVSTKKRTLMKTKAIEKRYENDSNSHSKDYLWVELGFTMQNRWLM